MEVRFQNSPNETSEMNTQQLRSNFLFTEVMTDDTINLLYTHYDRMIIGGIKPVNNVVDLPNPPELRANYFLERREIGIINVGGDGKVQAGKDHFSLNKMDCLYIGKGVENVTFSSADAKAPALFYILSSPAHQQYPTRLLTKKEVPPVNLGEVATANQRTIYKYIHAQGIPSCQLVMGLTVLATGSVWNTMPAHTHFRTINSSGRATLTSYL